jgi:hypothetical protein
MIKININYIVLSIVTVTILYLVYSKYKNISILEKFEIAEKPNTFAVAYKKNTDLEYISKKLNIPITDKELVKTNRIAPITNETLGVLEQSNAIVPIVEKPNNSTGDNYVIPMPKFEDMPNVTSQKQENYEKFIPIDTKDTKNIKEIRVVSEQKNLNTCKFIGSFSGSSKCPKEYPIHTGASISNKKSLTCNGSEISIKQAKAIALINKGKISSVQLIDGGENYNREPRIIVRSSGSVEEDAQLVANIKNGKVVSITIANPGKGYRDTPKILIEKPNKQVYCNLCCKHEL